jgi:hypothetical protein
MALDGSAHYDFHLNGQPYVSFDDFAADGATTSNYPGLVNSAQYIPPGNYWVDYFQPQTPFLHSQNFVHSYDGSCRDAFTGKNDQACEQYYFQLATGCFSCFGPNCPVRDLPKHNGIKVIQICQPG